MGILWTCRCIAARFVGGHARGSALTPSASIRPIAQSARERSGLSSRSGHHPLTPTPRSLICRPSEIARTNAHCGGAHVSARRHVGVRGGYPVPGRGRAGAPPASACSSACTSTSGPCRNDRIPRPTHRPLGRFDVRRAFPYETLDSGLTEHSCRARRNGCRLIAPASGSLIATLGGSRAPCGRPVHRVPWIQRPDGSK